MTLDTLKTNIETLEKSMLAISSLNDICQQSVRSGSKEINLESCIELLDHLLDPAMYQIEAVRLLIQDMADLSECQIIEGA